MYWDRCDGNLITWLWIMETQDFSINAQIPWDISLTSEDGLILVTLLMTMTKLWVRKRIRAERTNGANIIVKPFRSFSDFPGFEARDELGGNRFPQKSLVSIFHPICHFLPLEWLSTSNQVDRIWNGLQLHCVLEGKKWNISIHKFRLDFGFWMIIRSTFLTLPPPHNPFLNWCKKHWNIPFVTLFLPRFGPYSG